MNTPPRTTQLERASQVGTADPECRNSPIQKPCPPADHVPRFLGEADLSPVVNASNDRPSTLLR